MATQFNSFPQYEISQINLLNSDAKTILNHWETYLEQITYSTPQSAEIIVKVIENFNNMIFLYDQHKFKIPAAYIRFFELNLSILYDEYIKHNYDKVNDILSDILEHSSSLSSIVYLYNIASVNTDIANMLQSTKDNLQASIDISTLSNLKGLAAEFDNQYIKYNKERIFWLLVLVSVLLMISSKLFIIQFTYPNIFILFSYVSSLLFILLFFNDDFLKDGITIAKYKINISNTQIKLATLIPSIVIFVVFYLLENIDAFKLFDLSLVNHEPNSLQDFIPHFAIYIPMIWLLWFSIKQYHYTTKIMNAYRFKKALSLAYNGYKEECEKLFESLKDIEEFQNKEHEYKEYLLKEVLQVISDDPTKRDFKDTHMPWSEIKDVVRIFKSGK